MQCQMTASSQTARMRASSSPAEARLALRARDSDRMVVVDDALSVGSAPNNDWVIDDPYVSRHHCRVYWARADGGRACLCVRDLGSSNGTWVNNLRIERCELAPGLEVRIGATTLRVVDPARCSWPAHGIIGADPAIRRVQQQIDRFGSTDHPVLIIGESGTGKELVARALHQVGRPRGRLETLNCAAIPGDLAESELFGHARGAFTGAERAQPGAFARASDGTLFLDELGEMPLGIQAKLLRAVEECRVRPVGSGVWHTVNVRVVAATNRDLEQEVRRGRFRLDLYHRLAICRIRLPPLRERRADIPHLVRHFLQQLASEFGVVAVDPDALTFLCRQQWSGNVRQLRAVLQEVLTLDASRITLSRVRDTHADCLEPGDGSAGVRVEGRSFADIRREVYLQVLRRQGSRSAAAAALRVPKSTFFDQLRAMAIGADDY